MTRLAVLADIHANLPALEAVTKDVEQFHVDHVIVAGDSLNWGPFPHQVFERITREGWAVIRGNGEMYLTEWQTPRMPVAWNRFTMPPWVLAQMPQRSRNVYAAWPDSLVLRYPDAPPVRVVHGSPRSHWESMFPETPDAELAEMMSGIDETTVIAGHTHLAMDRQVDRWHILNPGTVGVPLDGKPGARYMIIDGDKNGWRATFRYVEYDYAPIFREFERLNFVEACGVTGHLVVKEFETSRLWVLPFLRWRSAVHPDQPENLDLLQEFYTVNPWDYIPPEYQIDPPAPSAARQPQPKN